MMIRLGLALIWALHFLPLQLLAPLGQGVGLLFYLISGHRRRVGRTNLALCLPEWDEARRERLLRRHFMALGRSLLERGYLFWSSPARLKRLVRIEGWEHYEAVAGRPVIWMAPHFVGLDLAAARLLMTGLPGVTVYSRQKNPRLNALLLRARRRFGDAQLVARQEGIRPIIKALRAGRGFYYLPDMDFGRRDSVFVPFFGVPAATITGLSRLARLGRAVVLPVITRQLPGGQGYVVQLHPHWEHFPGEDETADARRMNAFIESQILTMAEQYFWLHKRFKTRPEGEPSVYGRDQR